MSYRYSLKMGATFANASIKTSNLDVVKNALLGETAFVSASQNWITVYPQKLESLDPKVLTEFAKNLSQKLSATCIVFGVYDSDGLFYFFCKNGQLIDQYSDYPDDPIEGKPATLIELGPPGLTAEQILAVLNKDYTFAEEKLGDLAKVLGIDTLELVGYDYLESELPKHPNIKPI